MLFDLVGLGAPFWWLTGQALSLLLWLAHAAADAPGAVALLPAMPPAAFALMVAGRPVDLPVARRAGGAGAWSRSPPARSGRLPPRRPISSSPATAATSPCARQTAALALLRPRAGDYVRDTLAEASGAEPDFLELETPPDRRLQPRSVRRRHRPRRPALAHPRHPHARISSAGTEMVRACAEADIVVADRAPAARLRPALAARRPLLPPPHRRPRDHARRRAPRRHRRRRASAATPGRGAEGEAMENFVKVAEGLDVAEALAELARQPDHHWIRINPDASRYIPAPRRRRRAPVRGGTAGDMAADRPCSRPPRRATMTIAGALCHARVGLMPPGEGLPPHHRRRRRLLAAPLPACARVRAGRRARRRRRVQMPSLRRRLADRRQPAPTRSSTGAQSTASRYCSTPCANEDLPNFRPSFPRKRESRPRRSGTGAWLDSPLSRE